MSAGCLGGVSERTGQRRLHRLPGQSRRGTGLGQRRKVESEVLVRHPCVTRREKLFLFSPQHTRATEAEVVGTTRKLAEPGASPTSASSIFAVTPTPCSIILLCLKKAPIHRKQSCSSDFPLPDAQVYLN